jgi:fido (protein-threonine AMPylation protein)
MLIKWLSRKSDRCHLFYILTGQSPQVNNNEVRSGYSKETFDDIRRKLFERIFDLSDAFAGRLRPSE